MSLLVLCSCCFLPAYLAEDSMVGLASCAPRHPCTLLLRIFNFLRLELLGGPTVPPLLVSTPLLLSFPFLRCVSLSRAFPYYAPVLRTYRFGHLLSCSFLPCFLWPLCAPRPAIHDCPFYPCPLVALVLSINCRRVGTLGWPFCVPPCRTPLPRAPHL